jgi:hypothetical protein
MRRTRVLTTRSASPVRQAHPRLPQAVRHRIASATWATRDLTVAIVRLVPQARTRQWLDQLNAYSVLGASFLVRARRRQVLVWHVQMAHTRVLTTRSASPVRQPQPRLPQATRYRIAYVTRDIMGRMVAHARCVPLVNSKLLPAPLVVPVPLAQLERLRDLPVPSLRPVSLTALQAQRARTLAHARFVQRENTKARKGRQGAREHVLSFPLLRKEAHRWIYAIVMPVLPDPMVLGAHLAIRALTSQQLDHSSVCPVPQARTRTPQALAIAFPALLSHPLRLAVSSLRACAT